MLQIPSEVYLQISKSDVIEALDRINLRSRGLLKDILSRICTQAISLDLSPLMTIQTFSSDFAQSRYIFGLRAGVSASGCRALAQQEAPDSTQVRKHSHTSNGLENLRSSKA